jgi:DICT domain-containing protein
MSNDWLSIGDIVARTGVAEPTLRMWERRHGFPQPARTANGHRRYTDEQVEMVEEVVAARSQGLSLPAAIERAQHLHREQSWSAFAKIRRRQPELEPRVVSKPALIALSHAIEDEMLARAERQVIFGCFQRVPFYRREQSRWLELTQGSRAAAVFADFEVACDPASGPAEIPVALGDPLSREWALVCYGERNAVCLAGRETASSRVDGASSERSFEAVWTVESDVVRDVARACAAATREYLPDVADRAVAWLMLRPISPPREQAALLTAILNRTLSHIA